MSFQKQSLEYRTRHLNRYLKQISPEHNNIESIREQLESGENEQLEMRLADQEENDISETLDLIIHKGDNAKISPDQFTRIEAIIHKKGRPAIDIINDSFNAPSGGEWSEIGYGEKKKNIENVIPSIGRIEVPNDIRPYAGTGFVVSNNLLMTNRHVAQIFALGLGQKNLRFDLGQTAAVDFKREIPLRGAADPILLSVRNIIMIHPYWDMALLEVEGLPNTHPKLQLSTRDPADMIGDKIVVIGYPAQDTRGNIELQNKIFNYQFEVKRLLPGKFTGRKDYSTREQQLNAVTHDSSTLGGNSGSAVMNIDTGEIIALHFAGEYLRTNYAISMHDLAQDNRVVDAGINFMGEVKRENFYSHYWKKVDTSESTSIIPTPPIPPASHSISSIDDTPTTVSITIPIHITFTTSDSTPAKVNVSVNQNESEGIFSRKPKHSVNEFIKLFSLKSLVSNAFNWNAALSSALASDLAYENEDKIKQSALKWGFNACEFIQGDNMECFIAEANNLTLVSFRGTQANIADWLTNMSIFSTSREYGRIHSGFLAGFQAVNQKLQVILDAIPNLESRPLILTGHSLGGALATIAAVEWEERYPIASIYTFGQPAVGKGAFPSLMQRLYKNNFFRFVNDDDIVTRVPPTYQHVGRLFHFNSSGNINNESLNIETFIKDIDESNMLTEIQFSRFRADLSQQRIHRMEGGEEGWLPSFIDHKIIEYITKIAAKVI